MAPQRPPSNQHVVSASSGSSVARTAGQVIARSLPASDTSALALHIGSQIEVVGEVRLVDEHRSAKGTYFFIDFGDWRQSCFRLVIWSSALSHFQQAGVDPHSYHTHWLRVVGTLEQYRQPNGKARLQIVVTSPAAITTLASASEAQALLQPPPQGAAAPTTIASSSVSSKQAARVAKESVCPFCTQRQRPTTKVCSQCGIPLDPPTRFQPNQCLARRYTVERAISRGGMGEIYLAIDRKLFDRVVVLKVMLDYFDTQNPQEVLAAKAMFEQEARTLSNLNYPAFPKIYDYFQEGADGCIVMEFIAGETLEQHLTREDLGGRTVAGQPYPLLQVVQWGVDICRSLEYLAAVTPSPVVHHDIKPANLLLDQNGLVRLVDFGTARPRAAPQAGGVASPQTTVYGTPGYAPGEQYRGLTEPRSDIFALGATLYHLVTDDDPRGHPFAFPRLGQLGPIGALLQHALDPDVTKRPSASELRLHLEVFLAAEEERQRQRREEELRHQRDAAEAERRRVEAALHQQLADAAAKRQQAEQQLQAERSRLAQQQLQADQAAAETRRQVRAAVEAGERARAEAERQAHHVQQQAKLAQLQAEVQLKREIAEQTARQIVIERELHAQQVVAAERLKREEQLRRAPDGTLLLEPRDVVIWCERFWAQGVRWLQDSERLVEQARLLWGDSIADEVAAIYRAHPSDGHAALDALLAQLDPHGFGAAKPTLQASGHSIDFGTLALDSAREGALMIKNAGRRYGCLTFTHPAWITLAEPVIGLAPGQERRLVCFADGRAATRDFQSKDTLKIFAGETHVGTLVIRATLPLGLRLKLGLAGILHS